MFKNTLVMVLLHLQLDGAR